MCSSYATAQNHPLHGVIYMHRMTDNRVFDVWKSNLEAYESLCGSDAFGNSAIVTTQWNKVHDRTGRRREEELKNYFAFALEGGAAFLYYDDTQGQASAHYIIQQLLSKPPKPLRIQTELVGEKKRISETALGVFLKNHLTELVGKYMGDIERWRGDLASMETEDGSGESQQELQQELAQREGELSGFRAELEEVLSMELSFVGGRSTQSPASARQPAMSSSQSSPLVRSASTPTQPSPVKRPQRTPTQPSTRFVSTSEEALQPSPAHRDELPLSPPAEAPLQPTNLTKTTGGNGGSIPAQSKSEVSQRECIPSISLAKAFGC